MKNVFRIIFTANTAKVLTPLKTRMIIRHQTANNRRSSANSLLTALNLSVLTAIRGHTF